MISTVFAVMSVFTTTLFGGPARPDMACQTCLEDDVFDADDDQALPAWLSDRADVQAAIQRARTDGQTAA